MIHHVFFRNDNKHLKNTVEQLKVRFSKSKRKADDMEEANKSHGILHDKMRQRLKQMDSHAQHANQQVG